jgi:hypothetical protein
MGCRCEKRKQPTTHCYEQQPVETEAVTALSLSLFNLAKQLINKQVSERTDYCLYCHRLHGQARLVYNQSVQHRRFVIVLMCRRWANKWAQSWRDPGRQARGSTSYEIWATFWWLKLEALELEDESQSLLFRVAESAGLIRYSRYSSSKTPIPKLISLDRGHWQCRDQYSQRKPNLNIKQIIVSAARVLYLLFYNNTSKTIASQWV